MTKYGLLYSSTSLILTNYNAIKQKGLSISQN